MASQTNSLKHLEKRGLFKELFFWNYLTIAEKWTFPNLFYEATITDTKTKED